MSDMIERATNAINAGRTVGEGVGEDEMRAALLAALDPEDEALVATVAEGMELDENFGSIEHMARAALATLRKNILAGTDGAT